VRRTLGVLMLGAIASALLARALPLPDGDALRSTLALLPFLVAGFHAIAAWTTRAGGRRLSGAASAGELLALAAWTVLALGRHAWGLARADEILLAAFFLLLAHRTGRQLLALRPLLGRQLPKRPSLLFFLLPFAVYLAILPWSAERRQPDGDEPYYLLVTHSLAYDGDAELTNNYKDGDYRFFMERPIGPQPGDPVGPGGERFSRHNEMLPLLLVPAYRLGGKMGALVVMAAMAAALAWMTLRLARHYHADRPGPALLAYGLVAFAPPLLLYSYQVWVEVPSALLIALALDRMLVLSRERSWGFKEWVWIGLPILVLPLVKIRFILISGPLVVLGWWYAGRPRRPILILGLLLGALAAGILLYNHHYYGNPLKIHSWEELDPQKHTVGSYLEGTLGLFWDSAFGLFAAAPLWFLLLPATLLLLARKSPLLAHVALISGPYLLIVAPRGEWYGGWSPPFRYALIILPLLGIALIPLLAARRRGGARALLVGLGVATFVLTLIWVAVPGWTYNFADGRTYVLDALSSRLGADVARFFPSSVRPRAATWIWPLASTAAVALLWWWPRRKKAPAGAGAAGAAACLALVALVPPAAARLPARMVEIEDPQVKKLGGHLYPDRWVIERTRYSGGWVLRPGERVEIPLGPIDGVDRVDGADGVAGPVRLTLRAQFVRNQPVPLSLDVMAGRRLLAIWYPGAQRVWQTVELGPFPFAPGESLVFEAHGARGPGEPNGVILDRVEVSRP
jgi:hypothetical protein